MRKISSNTKTLVLWMLFTVTALLALYYVFNRLTGEGRASVPLVGLFNNSIFLALALIPCLALLVLHAWWTLGYRRGSLLLILAFLTGLLFEICGVSTGIVFGGEYIYRYGTSLVWLGVPLLVPLFWATFIYASYWLVSSSLIWLGKGKSDKTKSSRAWLVLTVCLDGLAVVMIDFIMDPLQVKAGNWLWPNASAFFGVPPGNYFGWFLVAVIVTGTFRTLEYYSPLKTDRNSYPAVIIPVFGYGLLGLGLALFALKSGIPELSPIGFLVMFPLALTNLLFFRRWQSRTAGTSSELSRE